MRLEFLGYIMVEFVVLTMSFIHIASFYYKARDMFYKIDKILSMY